MTQVEIAPAELELALRRIVLDRLRIYSGFAACWGIAQLGLFHLMYSGLGPALDIATAGFAACAGATFLTARRLPFTSSGITGVGVALGVMQLVLHAVSVRETGEEMYFYLAALVVIAAGGLLLHLRWTACFVVVSIAVMMALGRPPNHSVTPDLVLLSAAGITNLVIHLVGYRYVVDIERLRQRDQHQKIALEHALTELRAQLADRERAEAQRAMAETERAALKEQLIQAQKMESLGTLAGGFAHDMNNVLGAILAGAELLREDAPKQLHQDLDDLLAATQRGAELTRNLLGFARRGHYRKQQIDVRALVAQLIRMLERTVPRGVTFESTFDDPCPAVEGDPTLLTQALVNLCLNSVDAMRGVGTLSIAVRAIARASKGTHAHDASDTIAGISVTDTGSGMDTDTQRRIFEPFFTTKEIGRGTGLGLSMVYGTVEVWGGTIEVESVVGRGTTMTLCLPMIASSKPAVLQPTPPPGAVGKGTILVVDDDSQIRRVARRILEMHGYDVHEACDGAEAVKVFEERRSRIQLVVLDMAMPVMGGADCFRELRARDPALRIVLASGYAVEEDARLCLREGAIGFIDKPYTVDGFAAAIGAAMAGDRMVLSS